MSGDVRTCTSCEEDFTAYQWNQKRCYDCIAQSDPRFKGRPERKCLYCGESFQPRVIRQMCCSSECRDSHKTNMYYYNTYGITRNEYNRMVEERDGLCDVCGDEGFAMSDKHTATLAVDHCHDTGKIRGLLCHNRNRALGLLQENYNNIYQAYLYVYNNSQ